jgi:hypothetical protein
MQAHSSPLASSVDFGSSYNIHNFSDRKMWRSGFLAVAMRELANKARERDVKLDMTRARAP